MQIELNDGSIISLKELEELLSELNKNQDDFER